MIVDAHRHLWSMTERHPQIAEVAARSGSDMGSGENLPLVPDWEETGEKIIAEMDEAGIDKSVILMGDYGLLLGDWVFSVGGENRIHVELMRKHPDRFIAYFGIDPRRPGAADMFETAVKEQGVRGLKLHPSVGYFPYNKVAYPLYEICQAHGLPITFHSGPMHSPMYSRYTMPWTFDDVAADFPDATIVLAHAGQGAWREALALAVVKPNVYLELSTWQSRYQDAEEFFLAIDRMRQEIGIERILWGSDFPGLSREMPLKEWVNIFRDLPSLAGEFGYTFNDDDADALLGGNAARMLGLG